MKGTAKWDKMAGMKAIAEQFHMDGRRMDCRAHGEGHIHASFRVQTEDGKRYLLQRINRAVFADVDALMENIAAVTAHLRRKGRKTLNLVPTKAGGLFYVDKTGSAWRMYEFIDGLCLQKGEELEELFACGRAFGGFMEALGDFSAESLWVTIPDFHNTPMRCRAFREALAADPLGRAAGAKAEIEFALVREAEAGLLQQSLEQGALPLRVCHNDTKINNVMIHAETKEPLCVLDLDTVMPGLAAWDFGDAIRSAASVEAGEGQALSLEFFRAYTRGFLSACPGLTEAERDSLVPGARTMALECGLRYLTDYLLGSPYFGEQSPAQNLQKTRAQFSLLADMEAKTAAMEAMVRQEYEEIIRGERSLP